METYREQLEQLRVLQNPEGDSGRAMANGIQVTYNETTTIELVTETRIEELESFLLDHYDSKRYQVEPDSSDLPEDRQYQITDVDEQFEIGLSAQESGTAVYIQHPDTEGAYDEALRIADYLDQ